MEKSTVWVRPPILGESQNPIVDGKKRELTIGYRPAKAISNLQLNFDGLIRFKGRLTRRDLDPATKLGIEITPSKTTFEPDQPIEVKLQVRDGLGRTVPDGQLAFFAVDDGVLALTEYRRPDPYGTFFHDVPLTVQMGVTLDSLLADELEDLQ